MGKTEQFQWWENVISGAVSGLVTRFAISPLDVVKIRLQVQGAGTPKYKNTLHAIKLIVSEEGFQGLWKGNLPAAYMYLAYGSIQFVTFEQCKIYLNRKNGLVDRFGISGSAVAGAASAFVGTTVTYPLDLLRTRYAVQGNMIKYDSISGSVHRIYRNEGLRGFYRGLGPSLIQIVPGMSITFYLHEKLLPITSNSNIVSGGLAGAISKIMVHPFDVVRKRLQIQGPDKKFFEQSIPSMTSTLATLLIALKKEGISSLYKGLVPSLLKAIPSSAISFFVYGECRKLLSEINKRSS